MIAELEDKPTAELRLGLGRDMRLTAPELASAYRDGMCAEGATVLDAGEVGTEMLYYLVGSRELDGGLMCTASHNPQALHRRQAGQARGDRALGRRRDRRRAGQDRGRPRRAARWWVGRAASSLYEEFHAAALEFIDPAAVSPCGWWSTAATGWPDRWSGRCCAASASTWSRRTASPTGDFPDHEPNPLLPENREFIMHEVVRQKAELGIAWDGDADRCFFIDDTGRSSTATS